MTRLLVWANVVGWPLVHATVGLVALRLPPALFEHDTRLTAARAWERDGRVYRERLAIRRWKALLPDGSPWLGGPRRKRLHSRDRSLLLEFAAATRRAEWAHWCMMGCAPVFFLWNPPWACFVMAGYAMAANLPCIAVQRYNRMAVSRLTRRGRPLP